MKEGRNGETLIRQLGNRMEPTPNFRSDTCSASSSHPPFSVLRFRFSHAHTNSTPYTARTYCIYPCSLVHRQIISSLDNGEAPRSARPAVTRVVLAEAHLAPDNRHPSGVLCIFLCPYSIYDGGGRTTLHLGLHF